MARKLLVSSSIVVTMMPSRSRGHIMWKVSPSFAHHLSLRMSQEFPEIGLLEENSYVTTWFVETREPNSLIGSLVHVVPPSQVMVALPLEMDHLPPFPTFVPRSIVAKVWSWTLMWQAMVFPPMSGHYMLRVSPKGVRHESLSSSPCVIHSRC